MDAGCLSDGLLHKLVEKRIIRGANVDHVQPASLDTQLGAFAIELQEPLRPCRNRTIQDLLSDIEPSHKHQFSLQDRATLKAGLTYLVPLQETVSLSVGQRLRGSTKSSIGRLFTHCRLLSDFGYGYDEIDGTRLLHGNKSLGDSCSPSLYLVVQPKVFDITVGQGDALSQLRLFYGDDVVVNHNDLLSAHNSSPLCTGDDSYLMQPTTQNGVPVHIDVLGKHTDGLVALQARRRHEPIDISKIGAYRVEDYFTPIHTDDSSIRLEPGAFYLMVSSEQLHIPSHLSAELLGNSPSGISGPVHYAGFIDNGFCGYLVYEILCAESTPVTLRHGDQLSELVFFRTAGTPESLYGNQGSHYQQQTGPRPSKHFRL